MLNMMPGASFRILALAVVAFGFVTLAGAQTVTNTNPPTATVVLPKSVPDPLEPFNRVMWGFNKAVMTSVVKPTSRVYRFVIRKPLRTGLSNFGKNLTYPGRLINNVLQGKWTGARD